MAPWNHPVRKRTLFPTRILPYPVPTKPLPPRWPEVSIRPELVVLPPLGPHKNLSLATYHEAHETHPRIATEENIFLPSMVTPVLEHRYEQDHSWEIHQVPDSYPYAEEMRTLPSSSNRPHAFPTYPAPSAVVPPINYEWPIQRGDHESQNHRQDVVTTEDEFRGLALGYRLNIQQDGYGPVGSDELIPVGTQILWTRTFHSLESDYSYATNQRLGNGDFNLAREHQKGPHPFRRTATAYNNHGATGGRGKITGRNTQDEGSSRPPSGNSFTLAYMTSRTQQSEGSTRITKSPVPRLGDGWFASTDNGRTNSRRQVIFGKRSDMRGVKREREDDDMVGRTTPGYVRRVRPRRFSHP